MLTVKILTMSSLELVDLINSSRKEGEATLRHDSFMAKVPAVLGKSHAPKFFGTQKYGNNNERKIYNFPKREACLMAMSYSYELQAKVFDRMTELEAQQAKPAINSPLDAQLALAESAARMLNMADSGKVTMLTSLAEANGINSSFLPQYVVDAPAGDTTGSSGATKSATALLADWGKPYTIRQFNKILNTLGFIEPMVRVNSKGEEVVFNSITEQGLEYGKNITSPRNPREVQPHWYVDKFEQLLKLADFCEWR